MTILTITLQLLRSFKLEEWHSRIWDLHLWLIFQSLPLGVMISLFTNKFIVLKKKEPTRFLTRVIFLLMIAPCIRVPSIITSLGMTKMKCSSKTSLILGNRQRKLPHLSMNFGLKIHLQVKYL